MNQSLHENTEWLEAEGGSVRGAGDVRGRHWVAMPGVSNGNQMSWFGSPGGDRETRIPGQVVCLGGDLRSISRGGGSESGRGRRAVKGAWSRKLPPWELGEPV